MVVSKENMEELNDIRDTFYSVLKGMDVFSPDDEGRIEFNGRRLVLIDTESFAIPFEIMGPVNKQVMYQLGIRAGKEIMENMLTEKKIIERFNDVLDEFDEERVKNIRKALDRYGTDSLEGILSKTAGYGMYAGWASDIMVPEVDDENKYVRWKAENLFEAYAKRIREVSSGEPVCNFTAGVLAGYQMVLWDSENISTRELKCSVKENGFCEFEVFKDDETEEAGGNAE